MATTTSEEQGNTDLLDDAPDDPEERFLQELLAQELESFRQEWIQELQSKHTPGGETKTSTNIREESMSHACISVKDQQTKAPLSQEKHLKHERVFEMEMEQRKNPGRKRKKVKEGFAEEEAERFDENLRNAVMKMYPDMLTHTYMVPPLYFNLIPLTEIEIAGQTVYVTDTSDWNLPRRFAKGRHIQPSDVYNDMSFVQVFRCLQKLGEVNPEPMFVILSLTFQDYLKRAAKHGHLLTARDSGQRGDFDVIIVHRQYGLVVCEIKSTGIRGVTADEVLDRKLSLAAVQLEKSEHFVKHIFGDVVPELNVRKTVILPWIRTDQLLRVLSSDERLRNDVCACLGAADAAEASQLCLCADQLSDPSAPHTVTPDLLSRLGAWFDRRMASGVEKYMTDDVYINIIARLCGPATDLCVPDLTYGVRVEVKTESDAVSEVGERMAVPVLFPRQADLLSTAPRLQFLTGPPGTGKSRTLYMMARVWLREGHHVHVLSTSQSSRAVSFLLTHQLQDAVREMSGDQPKPGEVHRHHYNFEEGDIDEAVEGLASVAWGRQLHVIADEAGPDFGDTFANFCQNLLDQVPDLHLWTATMFRELRPECLLEERLTVPCRCPPTVHSEVGKSVFLNNGKIESYTERETPVPTDGPTVKWLKHRDQPGHSQGDPEDCQMCGHNIADMLAGLISLALEDRGEMAFPDNYCSVRVPRRLEYRDVFVLCHSPEEESGVVQGLRSSGVPVRVVKKRDPDDVVRDMALAISDVVTVADATVITGLERKIVVGVGSIGRCTYSRLLVSSRCTAQLVWIDPEPDISQRPRASRNTDLLDDAPDEPKEGFLQESLAQELESFRQEWVQPIPDETIPIPAPVNVPAPVTRISGKED